MLRSLHKRSSVVAEVISICCNNSSCINFYCITSDFAQSRFNSSSSSSSKALEPTQSNTSNNNNNEHATTTTSDTDPDDPPPCWLPGTGGVPQNFWSSPSNRRRFFDWVAKKLHIAKPEDWYQVKRSQIIQLGGERLLRRFYRNSHIYALIDLYPEHGLLSWRFTASRGVPKQFWQINPDQQRRFFDWIAKQLRIEKREDWYRVTTTTIAKMGGSSLLKLYDYSLFKALSTVYPPHDNPYRDHAGGSGGSDAFEWLPWKFTKVSPRGFWDDPANHRKFLDWAAKELRIRDPAEDWYRITAEDIIRLGGSVMLQRHYGSSLYKALISVYRPDELGGAGTLVPWRFASSGGVPNKFWDDLDNQRRFFAWAATKLNPNPNLNLSSSSSNSNNNNSSEGLAGWHEFWYDVSAEDVMRLGGTGLLYGHYEGSLQKALAAVYPSVSWDSWRFKRCSSSSSVNDHDDTELLRRYVVEYLQRKLHIARAEDWYRVSTTQIRELGGYTILARHGGLLPVLKRIYPEHDWREEMFDRRRGGAARGKKAAQWWLKVALQKIISAPASASAPTTTTTTVADR